MNNDAYARIALRLRGLAAVDREWILQKLDAQECRSISAALQRLRMENMVGQANVTASTDARVSRRAEREKHLQILESLPAASVLGVMKAQPDWVLAVVLAAARGSWNAQLLQSLAPERVRVLHLLTNELSPRVKPAVRDAVLRMLVAKIESQEAVATAFSPFDAVLDRVVRPSAEMAQRIRERL